MSESNQFPTPGGRNPFGLAHSLKVAIKGAVFTAPTRHERKIERSLKLYEDTEDAIAECVMQRLRQQFRITFRGSDDESDDARKPD